MSSLPATCKIDHPVFIMEPVSVRGNVSIGKYSYMMQLGNISPEVTIGRYCSIASNVTIGATPHPIEWLSSHPFQYAQMPHIPHEMTTLKKWDKHENMKPTNIGNDVWIGANAVIMQGVTVGDGAAIGAGAVVTKDVPPYAVVLGVPGKVTRYRFDERTIAELLALKWWELDVQYLNNVDYDNIDKAIIQIGMIKDKLRLGKL